MTVKETIEVFERILSDLKTYDKDVNCRIFGKFPDYDWQEIQEIKYTGKRNKVSTGCVYINLSRIK